MEKQVICKNIFKNTEKEKLIEAFNQKWVKLINEYEKNKLIRKNR